MTLSHVGPDGSARMVDVGPKPVTRRVATAEGSVRMSADAFRLVERNEIAKGDVLAVARIAGIQGAKRTAELVPLCHPLAVERIEVEATLEESLPGVVIRSTVAIEGKTGVEMEALTAVAVACLTVYDMVKAVDRGIRFEVWLTDKSKGEASSQ